MTHGLSGSKCLRDDERRLVENRLAELERELEPEGTQQHIQVFEVAAASVRIERCELDEEAWRHSRTRRAEFGWVIDRQTEAVELAQKIHLRPELIGLKLRGTLAGCQWLRERFRVLGELQRKAAVDGVLGPLDEAGRQRMGDLLGLSAEGRLVENPLDLPAGQGAESEDDSRRALGTHHATLIADQIALLDAEAAGGLLEIDAEDRADAEAGNGPGIDRMIRLIRRYESEARKRKDKAMAELRELQKLAEIRKKEAFRREVEAMLVPREVPPEVQAEMRRKDELERQAKAAAKAQPMPREEAPAVQAEAATETVATARPSAVTILEQEMAETPGPSTPHVVPISITRPQTRRQRKAIARAGHRKQT